MRRTLQLAAALPLFTAACACAQISNPDALVAPAPRNPAEHSRFTSHSSNHQWLWQYANRDKQALLDEPRFRDLLATDLRAPQSMWGVGVPLSEAARTFLSGEGSVTSTDNRHIVITGCVAEHCPQRGMLWLDLGGAEPLTVFSALRWIEQSRTTDEPHAPFNLWIFPSRELAPDHIPSALKTSLSAWVNGTHCDSTISNVLLVEPNGIPHILGALDAGVQPTCAPSTTGTPQ
jgi:hypothetical protein